ncbi:MAG: hypothetical protein DID90_2727553111 [Candidatus Nitrotoga sp. LAW]|nr:MAG: hypothetical protein DID90_2727553111 [Candidatus Nitrotoga sp. LAW]
MTSEKHKKNIENDSDKTLTCGLIMPISSIDNCSSDHWIEVKSIIMEAVDSITNLRFSIKLVSDADDVGVIQKRIVQNIYSSDIVICDVSCKNPNVMFELGMRLAFDKPTVIIKDDKTDYAFDTGIIEHVPYPRDLRFSRIVTFKTALAEKVVATHRAAMTDPNHSTFLKNFGKFQVANLEESLIPADKLVIEMLSDLQTEVARLRRFSPRDDIRRNKNNEAESILKITHAIDSYRHDNKGIDTIELLGKDDFYKYVEDRIDAHRHFDSPSDFRKAVDRELINRC